MALMSLTYRTATLQRFAQQREVWSTNVALRSLYAYWYSEVAEALQPVRTGTVVEIGSGAGFARQFLPFVRTSDTIKADWHDYEIDATKEWPFPDASLDGLLVFDVLHHLAAPSTFFEEATRTLRVGGRLVLMEPSVSVCSYPVYRFLHEEGLDSSVKPFADGAISDKDPFAGNQALPGLIFGRFGDDFRQRFPNLRLTERKLYSGLSYMASGGFGRPCLVPHSVWRALLWLDQHMPPPLRQLTAFRMLVSLERV
jgi:SAM-dependent methyltransferase